jgi:cytochrome c peroxidase
LTKNQVDGFNLFMGKAQCGICHFMPLFNGTVPPTFADTESEVIGAPSKVEWSNATIDSDPGRYVIFEMEQLRHAFKTPTVRNASLTAPYMHNGVYRSLEEVIKFYNKGGGAGIGIDLPNQTLPSDSLGLTETEQKKVIEFIHALTDTTGLSKAPALRKNKNLLTVNR